MKTTQRILVGLFIGAAVCAGIMIINSAFGNGPSKISHEWQSRLLVEFIFPGVPGILCSFIAYGLFRSQQWSLYVYGVLLLLWICFLMWLSPNSFSLNDSLWHSVEDLLVLSALLGIPLVIGILMLQLKRKKHLS